MAIHKDLLALQPQLIAYARAICGSPDEADELVQDAVVRALGAESAPTVIDDLRPWMFRVIRNLHIDSRRKTRVRTEYLASQERLYRSAPIAESDQLSNILVRQVFDTLSADHREVLFLIDIMGMRYAEAAGVLGIATGTIMSRLSRARQTMLERLDGSNVAPLALNRRR